MKKEINRTLYIFEDKDGNVWASQEQPEDWEDMKLKRIRTFTAEEIKEILVNWRFNSIRKELSSIL